MASDTVTWLVIAGVLVGVLLRTILPYLIKLSEAEQAGQTISFKPKYIATSIVAIIAGLFTALQALSLISIPVAETWQDLITVFLMAATYAFAFQSTLNVIADARKTSG